MNDFWSMSRNFKYRHHVEPRVKLYSPREESFPIPLKYIDVSRTYMSRHPRIGDSFVFWTDFCFVSLCLLAGAKSETGLSSLVPDQQSSSCSLV